MKQPQTLKQAIEYFGDAETCMTKKQNEPAKREPSEKENFENLARRVFSVPLSKVEKTESKKRKTRKRKPRKK